MDTENKNSNHASKIDRRAESALMSFLAFVIVTFYLWTAFPDGVGGQFSPDGAGGYYNLLVKGFMKGQLSLDAPVDPALATLDNPWDPAQRAGRGLHDASYYNNRYYIYFGVTPALLLFLPFRLVSGSFISEALGSAVFVTGGLLCGLFVLRRLRNVYFPRLTLWWVAAAVVSMGLGTMIPALLRRASIWEVPISCAYFCVMAAIAALCGALTGKHKVLAMVVAGLAVGLAIGSRPVHILACLALLFPAWNEAKRRPGGLRENWRSGPVLKLLVAAFTPLVLVGFALGWYNYARFESPFEFGQTYQMAGDEVAKLRLFDVRYPLYGLRVYLFSAPGLTPYFPYVTVINVPPGPPGHLGIENPYGMFPAMPITGLLLFLPLLLARAKHQDRSLHVLVGAVAWLALSSLLVVSSFGGLTNRYMVDFLPQFMVLTCVGMFAAANVMGEGWAGRLTRLVIGGAVIWTVSFNVLVSLQHNQLFRVEHPDLYQRVAHAGNRVSDALDRALGTRYGPLKLEVVFPSGVKGKLQPLVVTGGAFLSDYLFVHYVEHDKIQFGLVHTSRGTFTGDVVSIRPGGVHTVTIEMGSLYPPAAHPYFDDFPPTHARHLQQLLQVKLDGVTVLRRGVWFYDATSRDPSVGNAEDRPAFTEPFTGQIISSERLPVPRAAEAESAPAPIRLKVSLPPFPGKTSEPLLSTGKTGAGDLIFITYESEGHISFGHDHWGHGAATSDVIEVKPDSTVAIEIDFSGLYPIEEAKPGERREGHLKISVDGLMVFNRPIMFFPADSLSVTVGVNAIGASSAGGQFSGMIERIGGGAKGL